MKYTKKFQQGGYLAYVPTPLNPPTLPTYNPGTSAGVPGNSSAQQAAGGFDWLDKDLKKELAKGGLTNDVNALYSQLAQIGNSPNAFLDPNNRQMIYAVGAQINELQRNKEMWANSYGIAEKSGGLSEVAVGNNGEIYVRDSEGIIRGISVEAYKKRPQLYTALSVAELLEKRNTDRQLTNNNEVFNVANNAIGIKNIISDIQKIITALGKESTSETNIYDRDALKNELDNISYDIQMTGRQMTNSERKGFALLNTLMSSPSRYNEIMSSESTNRNHLDKAISYIWSTMSDPAQRKLTAQAALNNTTVEQIITSAAIQFTGDSTQTNIKPISEAQAKTGSSGSSSKDSLVSKYPVELFHNDHLNNGEKYVFNLGGSKVTATASATGPLFTVTKDGSTIPPTLISSILENHNYNAIVDPNKAYIGDELIHPNALKELAYTGENTAKVYLPVNPDGSPNLTQLEDFTAVYEEFQKNKDDWTLEESKEFFRNNNFRNVNIIEIPTEQGKLTKVLVENDVVKPFLLLPVITNNASDIAKNPFMVKSTDKSRDKDLIDKAFSIPGYDKKNRKISINTKPDKMLKWEHPYRGNLLIAYRDESHAYVSSSVGNVKHTSATVTDISRNLNHSSNETHGPLYGSAQELLNK